MNRLIEFGLGINLVRETLKMALGQNPNLDPPYRRHVFAHYITLTKTGVLQKVTGRNKASRCPGVKDVYVKPRKGTILRPPLSMGHRYAYVIAAGDTEQEAEDNAKNAAAKIEFWLAPLNNTNNEEVSPTGKFFDE